MRLASGFLRAIALVSVLAGCGEAARPSALPPSDVVVVLRDAPPSVTDRPVFDAGVTDLGAEDAGALDAASDARNTPFDVDPNRVYPGGPVGGSVGNVVARFTFLDCAGVPYDFGGPEFLRARATVLALFTGTCTNCGADARTLQSIYAQYAPRGVRVVAAILEGSAPMEQPSATFCQQWRTSAGATHPVLIDVSRTLDYLNQTRVFPLFLVIDALGTIRGRYVAQPDWSNGVRAQLDALVP